MVQKWSRLEQIQPLSQLWTTEAEQSVCVDVLINLNTKRNVQEEAAKVKCSERKSGAEPGGSNNSGELVFGHSVPKRSSAHRGGTRWVAYLDLPVVADGSDGCGASQGALCAAGAELHHRLGPAHQAGQRTPVLNQLLLLLLQETGSHTLTSAPRCRRSQMQRVMLSIFLPV